MLTIVFRTTLFFVLSVKVFAEGIDCKIAESAISEASAIRGLAIKTKVPCFIRDREQIKSYLKEAIKKELTPEKIKYEQLIMKRLGLIPEDFNYETGILEAYLSQLGGYYDPEKNHYVMAAWIPEFMQLTVAVHELTHALQDQYYNLETIVHSKKLTTDEQLARAALIEGDATAVMTDYAYRLTGQPELAKQVSLENVMMQNVLGAGLTSGMNNIPQSLIHLMIFPYTSGLRFAHALLKQGGYKKIDQAFKDLPENTTQILHPEKANQEFKKISNEDMAIAMGIESNKILYSDSLGEFALALILQTKLKGDPNSIKAANGWLADKIIVKDLEKIVWLIKLESEADTKELEQQLKKAFGAAKLVINKNDVVMEL